MVFFIIAAPLMGGTDKAAEAKLNERCMVQGGRQVAEFTRIPVSHIPLN